jgi:hypothetical protein
LYWICTAEPFQPKVSGVFSVLKGIGEMNDGYGLRKAFAEVLKIRGEGSGTIQVLQMPAVAAVGQGRQEVGKDPQLGHCDQGGT